ncbi:MAG: hypothetical protein GXO77_04565 [Calditrichaeota bacterium]|nr:hypothetical protein [Calditrichota bacterium]
MWKELRKVWSGDNLLEDGWKQSYEMLQIDHDMFLEAVHILRENDEVELRRNIRIKDKQVNKYERDVRRKVLTHLSVSGTSELAAGLVLVTIIIDIERIGDYTKNIVDLVDVYKKPLHGGIHNDILNKIEAAIKELFSKTQTCVVKSDPEEALRLLTEYEWINQSCDREIYHIIQEKDPDLEPGRAAALALYFRYLKRINSHLRNIVSSVVNPFDRIGYKPKPTE